MTGPTTFLTARWQDLVIITYAVPRALLEPRLPAGLDLDVRDGQVFASLVAFDFRDCRVKGVPVPGLVNFPEINLRFYVREKRGGRRGVVFIREFVPSRVIAWVARGVYNEPYSRAAMSSSVSRKDGRVSVLHDLHSADSTLAITARADAQQLLPTENSPEHFFKEHSWGYGIDRTGSTLVYEVRHPRWHVYANPAVRVEGDLAALYGEPWGVLHGATPSNVLIAVGSQVEVLGHTRSITPD